MELQWDGGTKVCLRGLGHITKMAATPIYGKNPSKIFSRTKGCGWLGRAIVLGSFQCRGVLLLWHIVGQGPAVLAVGVGRAGCFFIFFFILSILISFSNASSFGRWLDILKYCGLGRYNPTVVVSYSLSSGYPLSRSKPAQEQ